MLVSEIETLYDFNRKATEQVIETAGKLTKEQWVAPQTAGRGSIRDTLVHLAGGMRVWLVTWNGVLPPDEEKRGTPDPEDFPEVSDVRAYFRLIDSAVNAFIKEQLQPPMLDQLYTRTYPNGSKLTFPLWQMMLHVTHHSMQHRSEVAAMLTAFGHSPGELGLTTFLQSSGSG